MKFIISLFLIISINVLAKGLPTEYYDIKDVKQSKKYFFDYIYNFVENENENILKERAFVKELFKKDISTLDNTSKEYKKLESIQKKYRIKDINSFKSYMKKVDIVPASMALSQAAVESGWGRSRFIKEANNIFGHWTYNPKIGMIPKQRAANAKHFIRIFKTLSDSIKAYMLNLNRNRAYKEFQQLRYEQRLKNIKPNGLELSQTMLRYSGIGHDYLGILKSVIQTNKLINYDNKFNTKINKDK